MNRTKWPVVGVVLLVVFFGIADVIQAQFRARDPGVRGEAIRPHLNFLRSL